MNSSITITLSTRSARAIGALGLVLTGLIIGMGVSAAQAGAAAEDTAYTAIEPCASLDSRTDTGTLAGKYTSGQTRTFQITGTAPANQQSGIDCDVPAGADAVLINIVAIQPDTGGNLRAYATGDTGTGGVVNYSPVSPNLNNSNAVVIPLSAAGQLNIENNCGGCAGTAVHARGVILGYYTDNLAQRIAALETLLADVTRDNAGPNGTDRLLFTGMNLQLVDGTGDTPCSDGRHWPLNEACNGLGNIIIGYNDDTGVTGSRDGAHNLVIGDLHAYASSSSLVTGRRNNASGPQGGVIGGSGGEAATFGAVVIGGKDNRADSQNAVVAGGSANQATGFDSSGKVVLGGSKNEATGLGASVFGGVRNAASGNNSTIAGGSDNESGNAESHMGWSGCDDQNAINQNFGGFNGVFVVCQQ